MIHILLISLASFLTFLMLIVFQVLWSILCFINNNFRLFIYNYWAIFILLSSLRLLEIRIFLFLKVQLNWVHAIFWNVLFFNILIDHKIFNFLLRRILIRFFVSWAFIFVVLIRNLLIQKLIFINSIQYDLVSYIYHDLNHLSSPWI